MALPAGVTSVSVAGKVIDNTGATATGGTVSFRMPFPLCDGTDHVILAPGSVTASIQPDGTVAVSGLPATVVAGITPSGWSYEVTINASLAGGTRFYRRFFAPLSTSTTLEQLLAAASPVPVPATSYLPMSAVGVQVPPLVLGKVPVEFLPPGGGGSGISSVQPGNGTIVVDDTDPLNPALAVGTGIPQASVAGLVSALGTLTDDVTDAATGAAAATTQSGAALSAATAAQTAAAAAYVKPGGGIPETDLAAAVQALLTLAGTAVQAVPPVADPAAAQLHPNGHSINIPVTNTVSTINGEVWGARVIVEAGNPINGVFTVRAANGDQSGSPAVVVGLGGLNGFALFAEAAGGTAAGAKLADTGAAGTDDSIWMAEGVVDRVLTGVPTPTVRTAYWVLVSVRGYSGPPYFSFFNFGGGNNSHTAQFYGKYKAGGFTAWPATLTPATDLASGAGFVLPVGLRS